MPRKAFCLKDIFAKKQASAEVERLTMGRRETFGQTTEGVQKKACQDGGAVAGIGSVLKTKSTKQAPWNLSLSLTKKPASSRTSIVGRRIKTSRRYGKRLVPMTILSKLILAIMRQSRSICIATRRVSEQSPLEKIGSSQKNLMTNWALKSRLRSVKTIRGISKSRDFLSTPKLMARAIRTLSSSGR